MVLAGVPAGVPAGVRETPHSMPPAAIIAAGGVPFDMGTDTGGSIRLPSHCCGTAGLKPTAGRVPRTGHILAYDIGHMDLLTHAGPMARYVEDLGMLLPIIAGSDWRDPVIVPAPLGEAADVALPSLRMAFYCDNGIATPSQETVQVVEQAVQALAARGVAITEVRPPRMEESDGLLVRLLLADGGEAVRGLPRRSHTDLGDMHPSITWTQAQPPLPAAEMSALMAEWNIYRSQMLAFMEEVGRPPGRVLRDSLLDLIQHNEDVYRLPGLGCTRLAIVNMVRESGQAREMRRIVPAADQFAAGTLPVVAVDGNLHAFFRRALYILGKFKPAAVDKRQAHA